jgi:hypothetical protein
LSTYDLGRVGFLGVHGTVDVDGDAVRVHVGPFFRAEVPRAAIDSVAVVKPSILAGFGVHHWKGVWLVNGRRGDAVELRLDTRVKGSMLGIPVGVRRIQLGVGDAAALAKELSPAP